MNETIMFKEIMGQHNNIEDCYNFNVSKIETIVDAIKNFNPKNVVIVGRGTSLHAGIYARYLFELYYHLPVSIASQSVFTVYDSNIDISNSLVIGISQSGSGNDTLTVLKKARQKGSLTISIVNNLDSDIAKATDYTLYCNADKAEAIPATKTFTTTLFLINMLLLKLTNNNKIEADKEKIKNAIVTGFNYHNAIKDKVELFKDTEDIITLSRGLTLPLAMETALKIKETSHIHVSSYPISEFYHGPIAMLNEKMPVIILGIEAEMKNDIHQIIKRLDSKNIPLLLITNDNELSKEVNDCIYINEQNVSLAFFIATIIIQLFACELSLLKGYNPDTDKDLLNVKTF